MLTNDRDEAGTQEAGTEGSGALVPLGREADAGAVKWRIVRPDSSFVAHLIATAEQLPQTRRLRQAAPADAVSAYASHLRVPRQVGRTRHII